MFDIKWIRDNADAFDAGLKRRGLEPLSAKLLALDDALKPYMNGVEVIYRYAFSKSKLWMMK